MVTIKISESMSLELATSLRVVYALRTITGAKSLQEALNSINKLDLDGQLKLLYAAYKANKENVQPISQAEFEDLLLDTQGVFALQSAIGKLTNDLLYAGLSPEETSLKKAEVEATLPGTISSAKDTD